MARVYLDHLFKRFDGGVVAVNDLTIEVRDQEFLVLVGPSGCGKSTALRMIAGLEEITAGDIYIGDRRVNDTPPRDRDIAMVFQSYALYPHMSVYDNMAFGLKLRHVPKQQIEQRVREAARMLGIEELLKRKPRQLSGGQRQRVALGRAIVREPQAFLMDEPLSNLDAKLRVETRAQIVKLHHRLRTTTIYVTHDQVRQFNATEVQVGLRPEDISERAQHDWAAAPLPAMVDVVEPLGNEAFLYATGAGQSIIARINARARMGIGEPITLQANMDHMHIFDAATGLNILHPAKELAGVA